jgi:hypothetical protein
MKMWLKIEIMLPSRAIRLLNSMNKQIIICQLQYRSTYRYEFQTRAVDLRAHNNDS